MNYFHLYQETSARMIAVVYCISGYDFIRKNQATV